MAVWLIRAGRHGEDEDQALDQGLAIIGWHEMPDMGTIATYEEMKARHAAVYPDMSPRAVQNNAAQVWAFSHRITVGDLAVLPLKTRSVVAVGRVAGPYEFRSGRHVRKVEWTRANVPRSEIGQDLLYSIGAFMTVCEITRNHAEERFRAILDGKPDPALKGRGMRKNEVPSPSGEEATLEMHDLEEQGYDQIRSLIESKFKGHELARLVEAILNVQGYQTHRSPPGPDGGVDILAGNGPMGFERPRICVQVKSGGAQNDAPIRELEGVMSRMGAEQGMFVSWDGFQGTALKGTRDLFFKVRFWDSQRLIQALLDNYGRLPADLQAELPLKRIWVVVPEE